ncbi:MAG: hypothetical protein IPN10_01605 [Saprospiraceae bacterium]|nr:hypothetical protein [Saprospiraceae bacterium]
MAVEIIPEATVDEPIEVDVIPEAIVDEPKEVDTHRRLYCLNLRQRTLSGGNDL